VLPLLRPPAPGAPDSARTSRRKRWSISVARLRSAWRITSPPRPPSPPPGPPNGTDFSRRKLLLPSPPAPDRTVSVASSMNVLSSVFIESLAPTGPGPGPSLADASDDPTARTAVVHHSVGERVEGVVAAHADAAPRMH